MSTGEDRNLDYESGTASVVDMHDAVRREKVLKPSGSEPLGLTPSGSLWPDPGRRGRISFQECQRIFAFDLYRRQLRAERSRPAIDGVEESQEEIAWIDGWMKEGKKVYGNCAACHQPAGGGAPGQFPPLTGSHWVDEGTARLGAILIHGINGPFTVAGQTYNQLMPPWAALSDKKIAQVITYIQA